MRLFASGIFTIVGLKYVGNFGFYHRFKTTMEGSVLKFVYGRLNHTLPFNVWQPHILDFH